MKNKGTNNIEDDANLEMEFAKIGFDFKAMLNNAKHINLWTILLSAEDRYCNAQNSGASIFFSFTVIRYGNSNQRFIHHICATLLESLPNSNQTKILITKNYWNYNGPLPTKKEICEDIAILKGNHRKGFWAAYENLELN